jgi:hypothetical protein
MKQTLKFIQQRNDLYAEFNCECPSEKFIGSPIEHLMKQKITLSGYNDNYFYEVVNIEPRIYKCKCGRQYKYQWFPYGVKIENIQ